MTTLDDSLADAVGRIPAGRRACVDQMLLDLSGVWTDRYHRGMCAHRDPELWPLVAAGLIDAWTVLYLLGTLRIHAPQVAEDCAHFLNLMDAERMPGFAHEWHLAIAEGRSLVGLVP